MLKLKLQYFGHLMAKEPTHWKRPWYWERLKAKGEGRWQRMRWLDSITNSMDTNLSQLQEIAKDRGAWRAAVHGVTKNWTQLSNWETTTKQHVREKQGLWLETFFFFFFEIFFLKVFIWLHQVLVVACGIFFVAVCKLLIVACRGLSSLTRESNLGPLHWKLSVLATGPLGFWILILHFMWSWKNRLLLSGLQFFPRKMVWRQNVRCARLDAHRPDRTCTLFGFHNLLM